MSSTGSVRIENCDKRFQTLTFGIWPLLILFSSAHCPFLPSTTSIGMCGCLALGCVRSVVLFQRLICTGKVQYSHYKTSLSFNSLIQFNLFSHCSFGRSNTRKGETVIYCLPLPDALCNPGCRLQNYRTQHFTKN